jgi:hypothetical protein
VAQRALVSVSVSVSDSWITIRQLSPCAGAVTLCARSLLLLAYDSGSWSYSPHPITGAKQNNVSFCTQDHYRKRVVGAEGAPPLAAAALQ